MNNLDTILFDIKQLAHKIHPQVIEWRRKIHANPELAFEEFQTSDFVAETLSKINSEHPDFPPITFERNIAKTGIAAYIKGTQDGPTLALRADMDALPILEENHIEYCSKNAGKMHACGHDAHTSSLLGTAKILHQLRDHIKGTVKLIFQPSEEKLPGGASVMINEGILNGVQSIIGQHVMPLIEVGKIGICSGKYMASADEIYITIKGKGGHGAQPHTTIDPIVVASHIILALQTVVSRNADPRLPSVLTIGKVEALGATNIIPEFVKMEGTFRTFDENWRAKAHERITQIVNSVAEGLGASAELTILKGYPVLYNNEELTNNAKNNIIEYMGAENVVDIDIWMASEDFAYYTQQIPGCFYRLGTRNEARGIVHGLHTPKFNIDERSLSISTGLMAWLAIKELSC